MKKYLLTMVVMAIFAIGFAASDDDSNSSPEDKQEKEYKMAKDDALSFASGLGSADAEENANEYLRQGYSRSDLKNIAERNAERSFKNDWKPGSFKPSEESAIKKEYIRLYVEGYMNTLGTTIYK